jgi:hypothetical protein
LVEALFAELRDVAAPFSVSLTALENRFNFFEGETDRLGLFDEANAPEGFGRVNAMV